MPEIRLFNLVIDSTLLMAILAIIGLIIAYLNYRKKPSPTFQNCTFQIQTMNPNDLSNESIVKKISDCIIKNVPEFTGNIEKYKKFELNDDKLKLLNAISDKVGQYSKASGKILKDSNILRAIGSEAYYLGKFDDSFKHLSEALYVDEELKDIRGKATDLNNIGMVYQQWGKLEKALEYYQKALEIAEQLKDIRGKAIRLNNIGSVYQQWGQPQEALEYYQKALDIAEQLKDIKTLKVKAGGLNNIGMVYQQLGDREKALEYFQKALKIFADLRDERSSAIVKGNINILGTQEV